MAQENAEQIKGGAENGSAKPVVFSSLKPQLFVQAPKAAEAVLFYKAAFGAEELKRSTHPKRKADQELPLILCAELKLGPSVLLVCDQIDETAKLTDGAGFAFYLETEDVEGAIANAVKAGAVIVDEISDEDEAGCGGRSGKVKDPFGFVWAICAVGKIYADVAV